MAATARTHGSLLNTALPGADLTENYQNAVLLVHTLIKLAGGVVQASSDGVTADANDNISVIADIISDSGTNDHSWCVYLMPAGYYLCWEAHDGASPPRHLDFFGADAGGYDLTSPVITAKPTATTAANEWSYTSIDLVPTATPATPMTYHQNYTETGEFWLGISVDGTGYCETLIWQPVYSNPDNANFPYAFYFASGPTTSSGAYLSPLTSGSNYRGHAPSGVDYSSLSPISAASAMSNFPSGISHGNSQPPIVPLTLNSNNSGATRIYGTPDDIRVGPAAMSSNIVEDGDTDTYRRVTMGNLWVMVLASQLNAGPNFLDL